MKINLIRHKRHFNQIANQILWEARSELQGVMNVAHRQFSGIEHREEVLYVELMLEEYRQTGKLPPNRF
jgi:hypothetical protein